MKSEMEQKNAMNSTKWTVKMNNNAKRILMSSDVKQ